MPKRIISLFSGIGGSSEGYILAGFKPLAAVEFLDYQAEVYRINHPETKVYEEDIRNLDPLKVLEDVGVGVGELEILDGSPPCSSFSVSGKGAKYWGKAKAYGNKKQVTDDLFFEYIRFVDAIKPKFFVAENVKGLILGKNKAYLSYILRNFKDYDVKIFLLNSKDFGVAQSRNRVFLVGKRSDYKPDFDFNLNIPKLPIISAGEALEDIENDPVELEDSNIEKYSIYPKLKRLRIGESDFNLVKANPAKPSPTLTATIGGKGSNAAHHWENRRFTPKELRRLAGFPDNFIYSKDLNRAREGFGRAVTPPVTFAIGQSIKEVLYYDEEA